MLKTMLIAAAAMVPMTAAGAVTTFYNFDGTDVNGAGPAATYAIYSPGVEGWTAGAGGIELQANGIAGDALSARNLVELDTAVNSSMFVTLGRGHYEVSYYYSPRPNVGAGSNGISLGINAQALDSITGDGAGNTVWQLRTVNFFTLGGNLTFAATGSSDGVGGYLDDVTITSGAVPEVSTWMMLLTGFGLIGLASRRRSAVVAA